MQKLALICLILISAALASQKCSHLPSKEGLWISVGGQHLPCASTTRYPTPGGKGACGCGTGSDAFPWNFKMLTAAASSSLFGNGGWCGQGCGACYRITPTLGFVNGQGKGAPTNHHTQHIMVTNWCPDHGWCDSPNPYGYTAHFDLLDENMNGVWHHWGYDNAEVYYERIPCDNNQHHHFSQCECAHQ